MGVGVDKGGQEGAALEVHLFRGAGLQLVVRAQGGNDAAVREQGLGGGGIGHGKDGAVMIEFHVIALLFSRGGRVLP